MKISVLPLNLNMSITLDNSKIKSLFLLDPEVSYLNHGSFGACPVEIFDTYQSYQRTLEREPVQFMTKIGNELLLQSRIKLAEYIHCSPDDIVYTMNPSYAVNIVAKSFKLNPGDEVLATDIEYGACDRTWDYYCHKAGAKYIRQKINLPVQGREQIVADLFAGCNERTKLIFVSHITSSTALLLPVKEICIEAKKRGIPCFIDGAHAPGQVSIDLMDLEVDYYTGASHKWMMTPKGSSFLYVKRSLQDQLDPLIISWGYNALFPSHSKFQDYHTVQGTRDFTAFLTIPASIEFMNKYDWTTWAARNRALVKSNSIRFCNLMNSVPVCPVSDDYLVQMFSIPVNCSNPEALYQYLFNQYKIEIPVMRQDDKVFVRYSIQSYNDQSDLDRLYEALTEIIREGELISV